MPIYDVEHVCPLSPEQQDQLAEALTRLHSDTFTTPKLFVNVNIKDISKVNTYVAGKRRKSNRIIANVRHSPARTSEMYNTLMASIEASWASIVGTDGDKELRAVFMLGSIIAGSEAGFPVAPAGKDVEWFKENVVAFKKKAKEGDEDFAEMLEELKGREGFGSIIEGVNGV